MLPVYKDRNAMGIFLEAEDEAQISNVCPGSLKNVLEVHTCKLVAIF